MNVVDIIAQLKDAGWYEIAKDSTHVTLYHDTKKMALSLRRSGYPVSRVVRQIESIAKLKFKRKP